MKHLKFACRINADFYAQTITQFVFSISSYQPLYRSSHAIFFGDKCFEAQYFFEISSIPITDIFFTTRDNDVNCLVSTSWRETVMTENCLLKI